MRERMQEALRIREAFLQKNQDLQRQYQSGDITEELFRQEKALNAQYLSERLKDNAEFYASTGMNSAVTGWRECVKVWRTGLTTRRIMPVRWRLLQGLQWTVW